MFLQFVIYTLSVVAATVVQNNQTDGNFHYHLYGSNATEPRDPIVGENGQNGTTGHIFTNFGNVNVTNYGTVNNNYKRETDFDITDEPSARFVTQDEPEELYRYIDHNPEPKSEVDTSFGDTSLRARHETNSTIYTEPRSTSQSFDTLSTGTNRLNCTHDWVPYRWLNWSHVGPGDWYPRNSCQPHSWARDCDQYICKVLQVRLA